MTDDITERFTTAPCEDDDLLVTSMSLDSLPEQDPILGIGENPTVLAKSIQLCGDNVQIFNHGTLLVPLELAEGEGERLEEWLSENGHAEQVMSFDNAVEQIAYQQSEME